MAHWNDVIRLQNVIDTRYPEIEHLHGSGRYQCLACGADAESPAEIEHSTQCSDIRDRKAAHDALDRILKRIQSARAMVTAAREAVLEATNGVEEI